jgi:hypothetical protein
VAGFLASAATSFGAYLGTHAVVPAPVLDADAVVGSGLACAVICRRSAWSRANACAGARKHGFEIAFG